MLQLEIVVSCSLRFLAAVWRISFLAVAKPHSTCCRLISPAPWRRLRVSTGGCMFITYGYASASVNGNPPRLMAHRALVSPRRET